MRGLLGELPEVKKKVHFNCNAGNSRETAKSKTSKGPRRAHIANTSASVKFACKKSSKLLISRACKETKEGEKRIGISVMRNIYSGKKEILVTNAKE